jgi:hypothetical protein
MCRTLRYQHYPFGLPLRREDVREVVPVLTRLPVLGLACELGVRLDKHSQVPKKLTEILLVLLSCSTVHLLLGHEGCS